jgi:SAM-dependent methyltransferase
LRELSVPLPHEDLIFLVNGHRDREAFAISRWATVENIVSLLGEAGIDFRSFRSILDFGCGCGRVLAGWEHHLHPDVKLYGVDVNPTLVEFCKANIPFARVERSRYLPPLPDFSGDPFDFVYAASVFTHLDLKAARAWAKELHRVSRPGGIVMVSFSGSWFLPELT